VQASQHYLEGEICLFLPQITAWQDKEVDGEKRLERVFKFNNLARARDFTNKIGAIAEEAIIPCLSRNMGV
jgi:4a-hydroxytetrahydrobiopterin dehydratase